MVAVGSDRFDVEGLARAERAGIPTFVKEVSQHDSRDAWDLALRRAVAGFEPDLVVLAGFMKLVSEEFLQTFEHRVVNTHPALSPAFPGTSGPADALAYGVKVTVCTLFVVDPGVDTGQIIDQRAVEVLDDDTEASLQERIKEVERRLYPDVLRRILDRGEVRA